MTPCGYSDLGPEGYASFPTSANRVDATASGFVPCVIFPVNSATKRAASIRGVTATNSRFASAPALSSPSHILTLSPGPHFLLPPLSAPDFLKDGDSMIPATNIAQGEVVECEDKENEKHV